MRTVHTYRPDGKLIIKPYGRYLKFPDSYRLEHVKQTDTWQLVPAGILQEPILLGRIPEQYKLVSKDKYEIVLESPSFVKPKRWRKTDKKVKNNDMNNIMVMDTETNGKPLNYRASMTDTSNWPRVIQLGWSMYSPEGEQLAKRCNLIKPDGWVIPKEKFWIDNGYSTEINERDGIPMVDALAEFVRFVQYCNTVVAHNMQFDYAVLGAEMFRYKVRAGKQLTKVCTMEVGTDLCKLPGGVKGRYKWPTLLELHKHLLGTGFDGAHDAMADVEACARCYFEMNKNTGSFI